MILLPRNAVHRLGAAYNVCLSVRPCVCHVGVFYETANFSTNISPDLGNDTREPLLLWNTNRNSYAVHRMAPYSVTLIDP